MRKQYPSKLRIYFYPKIDVEATQSPNPYILDFEQALRKHNTIVNEKNNNKGVLDFILFFRKTDAYIFNWIEDLPIYRLGKIQAVVFFFFLIAARLFKKKTCWVLHNKYSHFLQKNSWTDFMYDILMKYSDLILTHSKAGIRFGKDNYPEYAHKIKYLVHPVKEPIPGKETKEKEYDFLIWGTVHPYKGILEFLKFVEKEQALRSMKILIAGRCFDADYKAKIEAHLSPNVSFKDQFFDMNEIADWAARSNFILFTHKATSVLSSGVLMDSIRMSAKIMGPNQGAFKDLNHHSFIYTYDQFEDIPGLFEKARQEEDPDPSLIRQFYLHHNWDSFADDFQELIHPQKSMASEMSSAG
jgi:beta-1,4-mannosyltransferase